MSQARDILYLQECSGIHFVRDYVELHFDGPVLTCWTNPHGQWQGADWQFPNPDALPRMLDYIGSTVTDLRIRPDVSLDMYFGPSIWSVPLTEESRTGPEAAQITGSLPNGSSNLRQLWIW